MKLNCPDVPLSPEGKIFHKVGHFARKTQRNPGLPQHQIRPDQQNGEKNEHKADTV
jgi:hypothetical protein